MTKAPVSFKCEDSLFQYLKDGKKPWEARWRDPADPRWKRLLRLEYSKERNLMVPVEKAITFVNKATGEQLTLALMWFELDKPSGGWVLLKLGHPWKPTVKEKRP